MPSRFGKPTGELLTAAQREAVGAVLRHISRGEYNSAEIRGGLAPLVKQIAATCASDAEREQMAGELERWVRWDRVPAYWLTFALQSALNGVATHHALTSRRLYSDAQININDDLALMSLESAFIVGSKIIARYPSDVLNEAAMATAEYMHRIYSGYRNWYSKRPYTTIEPLSEHLYNLRVTLDLKASFSSLAPDDVADPRALMALVGACDKDEAYLRVVARRFAGWAFERENDSSAALEQYQLGLAESTEVGLETETCHLLRYSANVLRRSGRLEGAESALRLALGLESHPELAYWRALSARELGRVLADRGRPSGEFAAAANAYGFGRDAFEASVVSSVVPVARAVKQQMFRAYADDAVEVASRTSPLALLSEFEAAGPRYATDVVVESRLAQELPADEALAFRKARAVFAQDLALFAGDGDADDRDFIAYIAAVKQRREDRERYIRTRFGFGSRLVAPQRGDAIAERILTLSVPDLVFLVFHLAEKRTHAMLIDSAAGRVARESIDVGIDFWRACSDGYHAALADAMTSSMRRNQRLQVAVENLLATCQETLGPLLEAFLPDLIAKQVKIVPRLALSEMPLHALSLGGKPLIAHCDVSYVPTLGVFLALHDASNSQGDKPYGPVTVIHDENRTPAYRGTLRAIRDGLESRADVISPPTWDAFAAHIATQHPSDIFFACHGRYDINDPRSSALQFTAGEEISFAKLFTELDLAACRSVLMGACESGLGRTLVAAEYVGLPLAFLGSGVRYVIGTLWQVNQIASAMLVARHYELMRDAKLSVPQALNEAQRYTMRLTQEDVVTWLRAFMPEKAASWEPEIRKRGDSPFADPYYWAGFYLTGAA